MIEAICMITLTFFVLAFMSIAEKIIRRIKKEKLNE
jgi:hypothetical protein